MEQGLLCLAVRASHRGGFSCSGAQALGEEASVVAAGRLGGSGARTRVAPRHVESSQTRDPACVPCIGRQILTHCTTREFLGCYFRLVFIFEKFCIHGTRLYVLFFFDSVTDFAGS